MNKLINSAKKNPLLSGGFMMLVGSNVANVFAYIYHPMFARILGKDSYGELAAIISIVGLLAALYSFVGLLIMKYAARYQKEEDSKSHFFALFAFCNRYALILSSILILLSPILSSYLKISLGSFIFVIPIFYISFLVFFYKSYLQGKLLFGRISIYTIGEVLGRFIFGLVLVFFGFGVIGASIGFLISVIIELILIKREVGTSTKNSYVIKIEELVKDGLPVLTTTVATTALFSVDLLFVRAYFTPADAGSYAAAEVLGKIILFATAPITAVLFPLISKKHANGENGLSMLLMSFIVTFLFGGCICLLFYFLPSVAVIPFGSNFASSVPLLFPYSIFIFLLVLSLVIVNYYLPREKLYPVISLLVASVLQIIGILTYHNTLLAVIHVSTFVTFALLINLLVYFWHEEKEYRNLVSKALRRYPGI